jgi:hypothetical protein
VSGDTASVEDPAARGLIDANETMRLLGPGCRMNLLRQGQYPTVVSNICFLKDSEFAKLFSHLR